jgi:hypothetical protein
MTQPNRPRPFAPVAFYAALALGWVVFARWVAPPLLTMEHSGLTFAALKWAIRRPPALFLSDELLDRWRDFSGAVLIAIVLHMTIVLIVRGSDRRAADGRPSTEVRTGRRTSLMLQLVSLAFLAVVVLSGPCHDYYFYLQMWYEVRQGHDPWYFVFGENGSVPLNAYGPLFNVLAIVSWVNPLAPKLLFAYGYILFAISRTKDFTASRPPCGLRTIVLTALFWNPFPWVEIAVRGHFDILVGLLCLGSIGAWVRGRDKLSGIYLALGVLVKFLPLVLLPFLAFDRRRLRPRFVFVAIVSIAAGLGLSYLLWGLSTFRPLQFAATRPSTSLSIFWFVRNRYSPLQWIGKFKNYDELAPPILVLALLRAWAWYLIRRPDIESAAVVAMATTVLLYRAGYPQYHMVPFVLGSSWAVRHWEQLRRRRASIVGIACYFGWLAGFDLYYAFVDEHLRNLYWGLVRDAVGLPSFVFGCAFLAAVVRSSTAEDRAAIDGPQGQPGRSAVGTDQA